MSRYHLVSGNESFSLSASPKVFDPTRRSAQPARKRYFSRRRRKFFVRSAGLLMKNRMNYSTKERRNRGATVRLFPKSARPKERAPARSSNRSPLLVFFHASNVRRLIFVRQLVFHNTSERMERDSGTIEVTLRILSKATTRQKRPRASFRTPSLRVSKKPPPMFPTAFFSLDYRLLIGLDHPCRTSTRLDFSGFAYLVCKFLDQLQRGRSRSKYEGRGNFIT